MVHANDYSSIPFINDYIVNNVVKTIINHPFGNGLWHLFMVIWGVIIDLDTLVAVWWLFP